MARTRPVRFWSSVAGLVAVLALGVLGVVTLTTALTLEGDVSEILDTFQGSAAETLTTSEGYVDLIQRLDKIERELGTVRRGAAVLLPGQWVPGLGTKIEDGRVALEMAERFTRATRLTLQGYAPVVYALDREVVGLDIQALRERLETGGPLFEEAEAELAEVRRLRGRLADPGGLGVRVQSAVEQMDRYVPLVELAAIVAKDAPQLVGELLDLRRTIGDLRRTLNDPAVLLERPSEMEALFQDVEERSVRVQGELLKVKGAVEDGGSETAELVDIALQVSVLLEHLSQGLGRFAGVANLAFTEGIFSPEAAAVLGEQLPQISEVLEAVRQELEQVNTTISSKTAKEGGSLETLLSAVLGSPELPLQREEGLLATGVKVIQFLTFFLGYGEDGPRKYLLLGQNDDEIRATGGFLGVVVEMTLHRGELVGLKYLDSDQVDAPPYDTNPPAPEPIYRYLWISALLFRDGNWNPHFPAAAAQLGDLYQRAQGVQVDGVIAATEEVVLDLVDALGGVRVPEVPELLDRSLAEQYVEGERQYVCMPRHVSQTNKRCFDEDLFQAVVARLLGPLNPKERQEVVRVLLQRLQSKDVMLHVFDVQAAELLWERGWNGPLRQVDHDYLLIVDSSLPGHARSVVRRRVQYQVEITTGQPLEAQLLVEYSHMGEDPDPNCRQALPRRFGCYWNYIRVFIPVVAQEIQAPPIPLHEGSEWLIWGYEPVDSLSVISSPRGGQAGLTEIGGYLAVEPQSSVTLPLRYQLPWNVIRSIGGGVYQYRLLVQKQPGVPVEPVTLFLRLPEGAQLASAFPEPTGQADTWIRMDLDLVGDATFTVNFRLR